MHDRLRFLIAPVSDRLVLVFRIDPGIGVAVRHDVNKKVSCTHSQAKAAPVSRHSVPDILVVGHGVVRKPCDQRDGEAQGADQGVDGGIAEPGLLDAVVVVFLKAGTGLEGGPRVRRRRQRSLRGGLPSKTKLTGTRGLLLRTAWTAGDANRNSKAGWTG